MSDEVSETYLRNVERPAEIVRTALRMILGAGLIITLILKVYMLVLTDHVCVPGETSLGAMIRCAGYFPLIGYSLAIAAVIEGAFDLFIRSRSALREVLALAVASALVLSLARDLETEAGWRAALMIGVLTLCLLALRALWDFGQRFK